jgi:pimeloyl-ACP methyl ester carboxylesterase
MRILKKTALVVVVLLAIVAAGLTVVGALHHPEARLPAGRPGSYVTVSGTRFRYVQSGTGPDVLLIHGSPGSAEDWDPIFERLAQKHRVTAYDRPGHGYSEGWTLPHTHEVNGHIALELVDALGLKDVLIVGHSYGGSTALNVAVRNPPNVHGYVVVGSTAYAYPRTDRLYRLLAVPVFGRGVAVLAAGLLGPSRVGDGVRSSFAPNLDAIPADFIPLRTTMWTRPEIATTLAEERVTADAGLRAMALRYAGIQKRVDLVYGADDPSVEAGARLAKDIPQAHFLKLEGTGHYLQYARPDALLAVIDEAIADAGTKSATP